MGTHAGIAVTLQNGEHFCAERTMDGHFLNEDWLKIAVDIIEQPTDNIKDFVLEKLFPAPPEVLRSLPVTRQILAEREHEPDNYLHIDFRTKTIGTNCLPTMAGYSEAFNDDDPAFVESLNNDPEFQRDFGSPGLRLQQKGWTFQFQPTCDPGHECNAPLNRGNPAKPYQPAQKERPFKVTHSGYFKLSDAH